jgi:hypothetical protein
MSEALTPLPFDRPFDRRIRVDSAMDVRWTNALTTLPENQSWDMWRRMTAVLSGNLTALLGDKWPVCNSARNALLAALWHQVEEFTRLPNGWSGDGAVAPSREIADQVGVLLSGLPEDLKLPQVTASSEGEIGLTWFKGRDRLDAIVSPDSHLTWISKVGDDFWDGQVLDLTSDSLDSFYKAVVDFYE